MKNSKSVFPALVILTGAFLVPVNSTMISIGLSSMQETFQTSLSTITWIVTIYLIIMTVTQPLAGKLGDLYGNKNMFLLGLVLFFLASLVCIYAPSLTVLMIGRACQAIGGALITPNGTAIIRYVTPKEQLPKIFGLFGLVMSLGAALGPMIGAFLIHIWNWQSTFWINVPLAVVSFVLAAKLLPATTRKKSKLDLFGSLYLGVFLTTIVLIVTKSLYTNIWLWALFAVALVLFVVRERRYQYPLIDFQLFKVASFRSANISILLNNAIMYCTLLIMPIVLVKASGYSLNTIGTLLFVFSLSISFASWLGGNMTAKRGARAIISLSFICSALSLALYFFLPTASHVIIAGLILFIAGIGSGLGVPAMQSENLSEVPKEMSGVASGIYSTFRYIGSTAASVIIGLQVSFTHTVIILIVLAVVGIVASKSFNGKVA